MSLNQKFAAYLAFAFILSVGLFNIAYTMSNLWKRKAKKGFLSFRLVLGFLIFCIGIAFGYFFIWMKRGV